MQALLAVIVLASSGPDAGDLAARLPHNHDYVLYLQAEHDFYAGNANGAAAAFAELAKMRTSRFAGISSWRLADCLWAAGNKRAAGAAYRTLLKQKKPAGDPVVARFHLAELAVPGSAEGKKLFRAIRQDFPAHPLAEEAQRRAGMAEPSKKTGGAPRDALQRTDNLIEGRHYQEAIEEMEQLPPNLPTPLAALRDYNIGFSKYHLRRDYPSAAALLLGAAPHLEGDKAVWAAFHGARALSRADRDDEAIAGYARVVAKFPRSRWAAEAQFLSGWLEFNRGRYEQSLPGLATTITRFARTGFARDAAWFQSFALYLLGRFDEAGHALDRYQKFAGTTEANRTTYWRARFATQAGQKDEGRALLRVCASKAPLSFYGLLARARLKAAGEAAEVALAKPILALPPIDAAALRDPAIVRADELAAADMAVDAGVELARAEGGLLKRLGNERGLAVLLDRYGRFGSFRRAYALAEVRGTAALESAPVGVARVFWEAAYPKAYAPLVEQFGPPAGNPDLFLYAIMRKESGFYPYDVSYADARGLLQMIPATSARVSGKMGREFFPDDLFDPETNVRLGAAYIGSLFKKFGAQVPLAAGAYNAGPRAMMRWCDQHGNRPLDEFVELIAYEQTREYIKRVTGIYARYRYLYGGGAAYELPLTVDARYAKSGPDF